MSSTALEAPLVTGGDAQKQIPESAMAAGTKKAPESKSMFACLFCCGKKQGPSGTSTGDVYVDLDNSGPMD